jgi:hypothetical protein
MSSANSKLFVIWATGGSWLNERPVASSYSWLATANANVTGV